MLKKELWYPSRIVYISPREFSETIPVGFLIDTSFDYFYFNLSDFGSTAYQNIPPGR